MTVVLDSNVLIDHLRAHPGARGRVRAELAASRTLMASTLTKVEVLAGMRSSERSATRSLFDAIGWIGVSDEIAERAGALAGAHRASHRYIETVDFVVAATAQQLEAELWTVNVRDFPMFPGLEAPY